MTNPVQGSTDNDVQSLQEQLAQYQRALSEKENDVQLLNANLNEATERITSQEIENTSLRRLVDSANIENDQLLKKLDHFEDNEKMLNKELELMREALALTENAMTRDHVIEKLKDVSIETRELIDNCDKVNEEKEILEKKTTGLEEQIEKLELVNETLRAENENLHLKLETQSLEIESLQRKLEWFNSQSLLSEEKNFWLEDITIVNTELQYIEKQIQTIIINLRSCDLKKRHLEREVELLRTENVTLQELNTKKHELIMKQKTDFLAVKETLDEYRTENKTFKENLGNISPENVDVVEFMHFKRSLAQFGNRENIEGLLPKLKVLHEIELFFEKNLSPHVESTNDPENDANNATVTDKKQDTINEIKNYLEKALSAIEKSNEKMIRMQNEYEGELRAKSTEISTLRELLSNLFECNKILEETLQQYKDNAQLDKPTSDTDELQVINETLLDGFDTIKQLLRVSEESNSFLLAKSEQLKSFTKLVELYVHRTHEETQESKIAIYKQKIVELFVLIQNTFDDVSQIRVSEEKFGECQQVIEKFGKSLFTKTHLKDSVETIAQEVKRLTTKVEHEMAGKIHEIETLNGQVDDAKTGNRELVDKIENYQREIVSLSAENYRLNEELESLVEIKSRCESLKQELEKVKDRTPNDDSSHLPESLNEKMKNLKQICSLMKVENENLRRIVEADIGENRRVLSEVLDTLREHNDVLAKQRENFVNSSEKICDTDRQSITHVRGETEEDLSAVESGRETLETSLILLKNQCCVLKKENEDLKAGISTFVSMTSNGMIPELHSTFSILLKNIEESVEHRTDYKKNISESLSNIVGMFCDVTHSRKLLRSTCEEMAIEFVERFSTVNSEIQKAVISTFENMQSSFTVSNEEMIREMQEMNAELKKRGEIISDLTQSLTDAGKENKLVREQITSNENVIIELEETLSKQLREFENIQNELENTKLEYLVETKEKIEAIENLRVEIENLTNQINSRDETIAALRNDIQKQKEMHDGDVSSVGTISKTEEVSRLKDVEDTFEERYMKLKIIAVKMKKSLVDLNQELKTERAERTALQTKLESVAKQAKMSQALQEECDKLTDDLELKANEIKELKKIIQMSDKGGDDLKNQIDDLRKKMEITEQNLVVLQGEKSELELKVKASATQLEMLNKEKLAEEIVKREKEKEIQELKQKLKELEDAKGRVQNELEKAQKEIRKQGALTLEMLDFEKTISDLRSDVESKESLLKELRVTLTSTVDENESLKGRLKQLEDQILSFEENNSVTENQIVSLNKTISEFESNLKEKEQHLKQVFKQLENEKSTNESLVLQLANLTSELNSLKESFSSKEASLNEKVQSLRSKTLSLQDTLNKKENEYSQLQDDYESYKVKAHNLLQKMKNENNVKSNEQKLQKEIEALGKTVKDLKRRLDSTTSELDDQKAQFTLMETAKQKLQERVKELMSNLSERSEEVKAARAEFKVHKLNSDTLINCYKAEIESLKTSLEETKTELQKVSIKTENATKNLDESINELQERTKTPNSDWYENGTVCNSSGESHDFELEHMDEAKTFGRSRKHSLVPLEELLESPKQKNEQGLLQNGNETELLANVRSLEEQVKYLTRILNESEMNAARNEQQVSLLKEEIRRLQRVFDREPHLRNTEYLKNVLIKFVTLPVGDEKSQLVTVLETILKLTPNEKQALSGAAKGLKVDQKPVPGWTSYLGW